MKYYEINGRQFKETYPFIRDITCTVVADDAMAAMRLAMDKHPKMEISALVDKGVVNIIQASKVDEK